MKHKCTKSLPPTSLEPPQPFILTQKLIQSRVYCVRNMLRQRGRKGELLMLQLSSQQSFVLILSKDVLEKYKTKCRGLFPYFLSM